MDVKSFIKQNLVKKFITPSITRVCVCVWNHRVFLID